MTLSKAFIIALLLVSCSFVVAKTSAQSAHADPPDLKSLSDSDIKTLTIRLERMQCFGSCPIYSVTIHGDGLVEYSGEKYVQEIGERKGHVEVEAIKALVAEFAKIEFWQLDEDYSGEKCKGFCTDMPTALTQLEVKGLKHSIKHYYGCGGVPRALFDLESEIDKTAKSEQWTGDVSQAGPMSTTCVGAKPGPK